MRHNKLFIVLALLFMCACSGKDYNLYEYASTHLIDEYVEATTFKLDKIDDNLLIMKPAENSKSYVSQELAKAGYGSQAGVSKFNAMAAQNGDEVVILKSVIIDDETEELVAEPDEAITDAVFEEFKELFADEFNFTDGEDEDALFTDAE